MKTVSTALAALLIAAVAHAQPDLTVTVLAPSPTSTWTFSGTSSDPVTLTTDNGVATEFSWSTDVWAEFRIGWDVLDPTDPLDPGWTGSGYDPMLTGATGPAFTDGVHMFTVQARDAAGGLTRAQFVVQVLPIVPVRNESWAGVKLLYR